MKLLFSDEHEYIGKEGKFYAFRNKKFNDILLLEAVKYVYREIDVIAFFKKCGIELGFSSEDKLLK